MSGSRSLAERVSAAAAAVPEEVRTVSTQALLNVLGTAIGASRSEPVDALVWVARAYGGVGDAVVPGRHDRLTPTDAALATGTAMHLEDFDDTHLATVVHPTAAVAAAALALLPSVQVSGSAFLDAIALGTEVQLRVALAVTPAHYDAGWHITGTMGPIGASVTSSLLLGLDSASLLTAMGIAASTTVGHREGFGTMTKALHVGKAAANGLLAARLAADGVSSSDTALEGTRGLLRAISEEMDLTLFEDGFPDRWVLFDNTLKAYPCGVVSHPAIEAAERLHPVIAGRAIESVTLTCHPLVPELTGNPDPRDGLEAKFSTAHGVAAGLVVGAVGVDSYRPAVVDDDRVRALRSRIVVDAVSTIRRDEAILAVRLEDGTELREHVEHVRGSIERPLTDDEIDHKVRRLVEDAWSGHADEVIDATRALADAPDARALLGVLASVEKEDVR